ncbi:MAG: hypothetical protein QGH40_01765 [bacterium]|nr:hypothetical protein [bacterium]
MYISRALRCEKITTALLFVFIAGLLTPLAAAARTENPLEVEIQGPRAIGVTEEITDIEPPPPPGITIEVIKPPPPPRGDQRSFWQKLKDAGSRFWKELTTMDHAERWRKHGKELLVGLVAHLAIGAGAAAGLFFLFNLFGLGAVGAVLGGLAFGATML